MKIYYLLYLLSYVEAMMMCKKTFSCTNCGTPFDAYPPDDVRTVATRSQDDYKDNIRIDYRCEKCKSVNQIYWGTLE